MKHLALSLVLVIAASVASFAQSGTWKQLSGPYTANVYQIETSPDGGVYALTNAGEAYYWDSTLRQWDLIRLPVNYQYSSGQFFGRIMVERTGALLYYNTFDYNAAGYSLPLGIFRSTDHGKTWSNVYSHNAADPFFAAILQSGSGTLFAFKGGYTASTVQTTSIYISSDHGASWALKSTIPLRSVLFAVDGEDNCYFSANDSKPTVIRYSVAKDTYTPYIADNAVLGHYCYISLCHGKLCAFTDTASYVIKPTGEWQFQGVFPTTYRQGNILYSSSDGYLYTAIGVHDYYYPTIARSSDFGKSWTTLNFPSNIYFNSFCFDSSGTTYFSTLGSTYGYKPSDGGVYRNRDHSDTWVSFGIPHTNINGLSEGPNGVLNAENYSAPYDQVWQDIKGEYCSADSGHTWPLTMQLFPSIAPGADSIYHFGGTFYKDADGGYYFFSSSTFFNSSISYSTYYSSAQQPSDFQLQNSFIGLYGPTTTFSHDHDFFVVLNGGLFKTTDHGISWDEVPTPSTALGIRTVSIDDGGTIYAGYPPGLYRSSNEGASWEKLQTGLKNVEISFIRFAGINTIVLGTNGNGVWRSLDHGTTWQQWGLQTDSITGLEISGPRCYAATHRGLMSCDLGSSNWIRELPTDGDNAALRLLKTSDGRLYTSLADNGIWTNDASFKATRVQHYDRLASVSSLSARVISNSIEATYITPQASQTTIALYDLLGREIEVLADDFFTAGETTITKPIASLPSGTYFVVATTPTGRQLCKVLK